jgi:hypothetical protein
VYIHGFDRGRMSYSEIKLSSKDGGSLGNLKCKDGGMVWESAVRLIYTCVKGSMLFV